MSTYAISYFNEPHFDSPEAGKAYQSKWTAWANNLGKALVTPAVPLAAPKVLTSGGVSDKADRNRLTGYSIVEAGSLDAAVEMAKGCPHLEHGTLEVAEILDMKM